MAVKHWHFGKIALLWVCGLFPPVALWVLGSRGFRSSLNMQEIEIILIAVLLALFFLVPITWKWLSGKEKRDDGPPLPHAVSKRPKKSSSLGGKTTKWVGIFLMVAGITRALQGLVEGPQLHEPGRPTTGDPWGDLASDVLARLFIAMIGYALYRWGAGKEKQIRQQLGNEGEVSGESSNHSD